LYVERMYSLFVLRRLTSPGSRDADYATSVHITSLLVSLPGLRHCKLLTASRYSPNRHLSSVSNVYLEDILLGCW